MVSRYLVLGILLCAAIHKGQCQIRGMNMVMNAMAMVPTMVNDIQENTARAALLPYIHAVLGPTAVPSREMMNFAVVAGAAPTTEAERDAYMQMLKRLARQTPAFMANYVKMSSNGTVTLDDVKMDAQITKKSLEYAATTRAARQLERQTALLQRQQELKLLRDQQMEQLRMLSMLGKGRGVPSQVDALVVNSATIYGNPASLAQRPLIRPRTRPAPSRPAANRPQPAVPNGNMNVNQMVSMLTNQIDAMQPGAPTQTRPV